MPAEASGFLVGPAVFNTDEGATSSLAGSIPVRLRHQRARSHLLLRCAPGRTLGRSGCRSVSLGGATGIVTDVMATSVRRVGDQVILTAEQVKTFLGSPAGVKFRRYVAGGVMLTAPLLFRIPGLRKYPLLRAIETLGGAALLVRVAQAIRDWDAEGQAGERVVVDIPATR